jgi:Flp pilus assembly pilin Flp
MTRFSPATPLGFLELFLRARVDRARTADSRGASAIEWVVISAIVVAIVLVIGGILTAALQNKANEVSQDIGGSGGAP